MKRIKGATSEFLIQETKTLISRRLQKRKLAYWLYENRIYTVEECARLLGESKSSFYNHYKKHLEGVVEDGEEKSV